MIQPPQHLMRSGVELLAGEMEKLARTNADLYSEIERLNNTVLHLNSRIQELELELKSIQLPEPIIES